MNTSEVFAKLKAHALEGMVFHDEMARYFSFLSLEGYKEEQIDHYLDETHGYRCLCNYYLDHYDALIPQTPMNRPDVIPESWYRYKRQDVDAGTKKNAVKTALHKWEEWETETKDLYEEMCVELLNIGEIAAEQFLKSYVKDVDCELCAIKKKLIELETVGYDITYILSQQ